MLWEEMKDKAKSRTIEDDKWEREIHWTVQRRYSQWHHQNQTTYVGLEK